MKRLLQYIKFIIPASVLWLISILPFRLLYALSDLLYVVLHPLAGYRKKVVRYNLSVAFPEKDEKSRRRIERRFYRHLADLFLEMVKTFTIGVKKLNRHWYLENPEWLDRYYRQGKSVVVLAGHQGNWEWTIGSGPQLKHQPMVIYKPLSNPFFEKWMLRSRSKFGWDIIPTYRAKKYIHEAETAGRPTVYGFAADQNPLPHKAKLWFPFFGKTVPWFTGAEETARQYELPVVFMEILKTKRGYYKAVLHPVAEPPYNDKHDFEITKKYIRLLEESIRRRPETYYWIHRRFKHAHD